MNKVLKQQQDRTTCNKLEQVQTAWIQVELRGWNGLDEFGTAGNCQTATASKKVEQIEKPETASNKQEQPAKNLQKYPTAWNKLETLGRKWNSLQQCAKDWISCWEQW